MVEAIAAPAAVLSEDRRQVHVNATAKDQGLEARQVAELASGTVQTTRRLEGAVCARVRSGRRRCWSAALWLPLEIDGNRLSVCVLSLCLRMADGPVHLDERPPILDELAPRYARVAELLLLGLSDKEIASQLALSYNTVRTYVRVVLDRAAVHSRAEFICTCRSAGAEGRR